MYGCLDSRHSRFFCQPLAQLSTALSRESLIKAAKCANAVGSLHVVYGDTDSIFVATDSSCLVQARALAMWIHKTYRRIFLELDYFCSNLLLLRMKYAALKVLARR